jgi:hypothetical protein
MRRERRGGGSYYLLAMWPGQHWVGFAEVAHAHNTTGHVRFVLSLDPFSCSRKVG